MSMATKILATARVTLTIEVEANGVWDAKGSLESLHKQAGDETIRTIHNTLADPEVRRHMLARVIGDPTVSIITFTEKRP